MKKLLFLFFIVCDMHLFAQQSGDTLYSFMMDGDVKITIDAPPGPNRSKVILICYALPNGNTTEQTMGKKMQPGDDWHYDIQHIRAQTAFIREAMKEETSVVVAYYENTYKSWPAWKTHHNDYADRVKRMVDTVYALQPSGTVIYLNGHSGGGRFIFSYIDAFGQIPPYVERISFLDSNYGYDVMHMAKLYIWLCLGRTHTFNVFAYEDSKALYEGKPVVSDTGGTWFKTHRMIKDFSSLHWHFRRREKDSIQTYTSRDKRIRFFLKPNPERKIYHTIQVERNGFIHSVLCGTKYDSKGYTYFGGRAYTQMIRE